MKKDVTVSANSSNGNIWKPIALLALGLSGGGGLATIGYSRSQEDHEQVSANQEDIKELEKLYGRVDERLKSIEHKLDLLRRDVAWHPDFQKAR